MRSSIPIQHIWRCGCWLGHICMCVCVCEMYHLHYFQSQHVLFNTTHRKFLVAISCTPTCWHSHELIVNQCFSSEQMHFRLNSTNSGSVGSMFGIKAELLPPQMIHQTRANSTHVLHPPPHSNVETNIGLTTQWNMLRHIHTFYSDCAHRAI